MTIRLQAGDALLIVDAQNDFFPGGALPVPHGHEILPVINKWINMAIDNQVPIYLSRDWHPRNHCSFQAQGGSWPVHCVQDSKGAELHADVVVPKDATIISKADSPTTDAYSAFKGKTNQGVLLGDDLKARGIKKIWVGGLALDYCVCQTTLDARAQGFEVHLLLDATRAITTETAQTALQQMKAAGVIIENNT